MSLGFVNNHIYKIYIYFALILFSTECNIKWPSLQTFKTEMHDNCTLHYFIEKIETPNASLNLLSIFVISFPHSSFVQWKSGSEREEKETKNNYQVGIPLR